NAILEEQQRTDLDRQVEGEVVRLETGFREVEHDLRLLARLPGMSTIVEDPTPPEMLRAEVVDAIAGVYEEMIRSRPYYAQVRLIGVADSGREIVRVDRTPQGPRRIGESELQQKGDRYYFRDSIGKPDGQFYFSRIDLNQERGELSVPHQPMIRGAVPIRCADGEPFGIVIINVEFYSLLDDLFPPEQRTDAFFLTNAESDYLVHPDSSLAFGFDLGTRHRAVDDFPALAQLMDSTQDGISIQSVESSRSRLLPGGLVAFRKAHIFPGEPRRFVLMGIATDPGSLAQGIAAIGRRTLLLAVALLTLALLAAYATARRLTSPLERITEAANRLREGEPPGPLPITRTDELGTLAQAFDSMASALREKETALVRTSEQLSISNADLEHFAHIASHDLREPARRVMGLSDLLLIEESERLSHDGRELLSKMRSCANQSLELITDFRAFAEIGSGQLLREKADPGEIVRAVLEDMSVEIHERRAAVTIDPLPRLEVYPNLVRVLYRILLENALEHSTGTGIRVRFSSRQEGGVWVLGVENTGSTIPRERWAAIFAPREGRAPGRIPGIGLAVARRIVERHSGRIWVHSDQSIVHVHFTLEGGRHG
ncbi:MAG: HAMP domain-containing protein, partial [Candidatus Eisenbacteria bacterium]|nr:HAMP domain-containing protein [Candidatus Eisenbacteria bacterium]